MAKRNQVTTELRISADAQLKNSRSFISQLEKIVDKFDFGDKINNQLVNAQSQLKNFNKALEKIQGKNVISDEELKNVVKAGKEIASLITKTEQLYSHLDNKELQKFSKEYINQVKAQEAAVAKIKNDYAAKTGKSFDKELANYDKLKAKIKELEKEQSNLSKNGISNLTAKKIEEVNKKLEEQKAKLIEIRKIQEQSSNTYSSTLDTESKKRGYKNYNEIKGIKTLSEDQIRKQLGNSIYKEQTNLISIINKEIKEMTKNKTNANNFDKEAIKLAKKYQIENVKGLNDLKQQLKIKKDILEANKKDKSKLPDEKAVTAEYRKQLQIAKDKNDIENAAKIAELKVIQKASGGIYTSKASLSASASATNKSVTNLTGQLTENGIETITNNAANIVAGKLDKLNIELTKATDDLSSIDETNKKLATQSERGADEQDIKEASKIQIDATNKDGDKTRKALEEKFSGLTEQDIKEIESFDSYKAQRFSEMAPFMINSEGQLDVDSATFKTAMEYDKRIASIDIDSQKISQIPQEKQKEYVENIIANIEDLKLRGDTLLNNALNELSINVQQAKDELKRYETKSSTSKNPRYNLKKKDRVDFLTKFIENSEIDKDLLTGAHATASAELGKHKQNLKQKIASPTKEDIETIKSFSKPAQEITNSLEKAAEQSQYLGSTFDDIKNKVGYFLSLNYVFDQMTRKISEAVQTTKEMDKDMTQIGLVLGKTSGQVWKNFDTYSRMAERLNTTTSQVTNSMKLFYQQGLNTSEVNKMVEASAIAAALGESTLAEASETLTSILNSYNLSASQALTITDKISQIAIVSAADFGELSTAIEKVASSAASAGLDLDHMMGYLAKMIETTREAPTNIGTALKTIVANFTQFKEDPTGLNEEGTEINKVDKALKTVGISLTNTNGEVRDLGDVIDELGGVWEHLNRSQKAYLATAIAGTRQQSRFYALMNDYERTLELVAEGSNSTGKAQQQFALYTDSLEAATNRLNNEWEKFFSQITSGNGAIKYFTDLLTGMVRIINEVGPIGTVLGLGIFIKEMRKGTISIDNFSQSIKKISENDSIYEGLKDLSLETKELKKRKLSNKKQVLQTKNEETYDFLKNNNLSSIKTKDVFSAVKIIEYKKHIEDLNKTIATSSSLSEKTGAQIGKMWTNVKIGARTASVAIKAFAKSLATMGIQMAAMWAIGKLLQGVTDIIDNLSTSAEEFNEQAEKANENISTIKGLQEEYKELANTIDRTEEQNERLKEITEEVNEVTAELGTTLRSNIDAFEDNIAAMDAYIERQQKIAGEATINAATKGAKEDNSWWDQTLRWINESFGDHTSEKEATTKAQAYYGEITEGTAQAKNLNSTQQKVLNSYAEKIMQDKEETYIDADDWYNGIDDFKNSMELVANQLKNMSNTDLESFSQLYTDTENKDLSYSQLSNKIQSSGLSDEIISSFKNETQASIEDTKQVIRDNTTLKDSDIDSFVTEIPRETLSKIFNPENMDILSENEQAQYWTAITDIFSDEELRERLITAVTADTENGLTSFLNNLTNEETLFRDIMQEVTGGLVDLATTVESSKKAFEELKTIIEDGAWTGSYSQLDIIEGLINNQYDINDIRTIGSGNNSLLTLDLNGMISKYYEKFNTVKTPFVKQRDELQAQIDYYSDYGNSLITDAQNRVTTQRTKVQESLQTAQQQSQEYLNAKQNVVDVSNTAVERSNLGNSTIKNLSKVPGIGYLLSIGGAISKIGQQNSDMNKIEEAEKKAGAEEAESKTAKENLQREIQLLNEEEAALKKAHFQKRLLETSEENLVELAKERVAESGKDSNEANINAEVDALKEEKKLLEDTATIGKNAAEDLKEGYDEVVDALEVIESQTIGTIAKYEAVFETFSSAGQIKGQLEGIADAYGLLNTGAEGYFDVAQAIANDPSLIEALDMESEYLEFNKDKLEEVAAAKVETQIKDLESRLEGTKAIIGLIEAEINAGNAQVYAQGQNLQDKSKIISSAMAYNDSLSTNEQEATEVEKQNLQISIENWQQWETAIITAMQKVENARAKLAANLASGETEAGSVNRSQFTVSLGGYSLKGGVSKDDTELEGSDKYKTDYDNLLNTISNADNGKLQNMLKSYQDQKTILEKSIGSLRKYKENIGGNLANMAGTGDSGSKDEFEPLTEKLEKFYNYLRQIEETEAKLNRLREKRNLIDASKNYYIDDLEKENNLLREQQAIYNNYIRDQGSYLAELQSQIQAQFSDWAYFNEDGVVQVKQTEFTANSEAEEERLNTFLELIDLYQNEYNTREENINKLYEIESTQLENIQTMYDKILSRVTDITDELNRQKDLLDHDMTMSFSNIAKFDIMDDQMGVAVGGISNAQAYLNDFEKQVSDLNKEVKNGPFSELLLWDETLNQWRTNEEALQDPSIITKYEKMGYTWQDIDTYIRSVAVKSQSINEAIKETTDSANEFAEVLKQLIDDRISTIQDFFGAATDELNKIFDTFNSKMEDIDNQNDLFGVSASALEEKYLTAVTAVAVLKQTLQSLRDNKGTILETIQKDYPEYIEMINGVAVVNKQAIEESTKLTEAQKSDLLQLYGILEASEDQITEMEDKLVDYFNTMMEMEREKRDAIIELKQSLHDELIARDQQEIDDLRSKYDKMSQLDNEYYSELSRRVSDARTLRDDRQQSANIGQMQAQLAVLKADNSGTYNDELINLQKQLNEALQTQADNEVTRELERIQREQQEREEDRQLTISAMENVLTFKDENSWYWQEAQRIWSEGPESVTGFLRASNEYANISDEQRAVEFKNLTNSMNTAFTTLQTESGISDRISDGIVTEKSNEEQLKLDNVNSNLDFIQEQLGESGLAGKIDWSNSQTMSKLDSVIAGSNADALAITNKMQTLYTEKIGPGTEGVKNAITSYLGENSSIWKKLKETDDALDKTGLDMNSGFTDTVNAASNAATAITKCIETAKEEYINTDTRLYNWLNDKYAKDNAEKNGVDTGASTGATVKVPTTNGSGNSVSSTGGNGGGSNAASKPDLKIGTTVSVKPGTRWYYDSYGTNPSGTARGGKITYTNLKGSHPYNIEGLGWIRKQDIVGYSKGGYVDYTGIANVHGTQTEPEAFLNAKQTRLFEGLRDSLVRSSSNRTYDKKESEIAKEEYNIDNISIEVKQIADIDAVDKITRRVKEEIYKDATSNKNNMAVRRR